ncbi:Uu.00g128240.m01.CDS01 [Anthostomella pinea]|uniref:Uu.00g128240.m01.CDS01 n=1 Tax=Anthostomella pinea TaxID=933095 RepID=A0AAI8YHV4_9PEZI|nr:Uu.00g128240.m01.CDS01 [Anthostomella pinea]
MSTMVAAAPGAQQYPFPCPSQGWFCDGAHGAVWCDSAAVPRDGFLCSPGTCCSVPPDHAVCNPC